MKSVNNENEYYEEENDQEDNPDVTSIFRSSVQKPKTIQKPVSDSSKAPKKGHKNQTTKKTKTIPKKCLQNKSLKQCNKMFQNKKKKQQQ